MPSRRDIEDQAQRLRAVLPTLPVMVNPDGQGFVVFEGQRLAVDFYTLPDAGETQAGGRGELSGA